MHSFRPLISPQVLRTSFLLTCRPRWRHFSGRAFRGRDNPVQVLAIETSCDDTSVALLSVGKHAHSLGIDYSSRVLFHERITSDSAQYGGIHPIVALDSHRRNLGSLVKRATEFLGYERFRYADRSRPPRVKKPPNLVAVTRGPGMRSNLSVGLDMAKGLAIAWNVPLIGVHHMQAHTLTPRLCSVLRDEDKVIRPSGSNTVEWQLDDVEPKFPFLTVLASGGHTMLLSSNCLTDHEILAETTDIALGDCLDKAARVILPNESLTTPSGKALEDFAFDGDGFNPQKYNYSPPISRGNELQRKPTRWDWSLLPPLADSKGGEKSSRRMIYSFAGVLSNVERLVEGSTGSNRSIEERRELARETMRIAFEHLSSRIFIYLQNLPQKKRDEIKTIVVSGGVAANGFLRHILRSTLDQRGYAHVHLEFPPMELCTDNALMIAWAGLEMYDSGYTSSLDIGPIRKWSMDPRAEGGGILLGENKKTHTLR